MFKEAAEKRAKRNKDGKKRANIFTQGKFPQGYLRPL